MAPWNFPIDISLGPLVDILPRAIAAIVKRRSVHRTARSW